MRTVHEHRARQVNRWKKRPLIRRACFNINLSGSMMICKMNVVFATDNAKRFKRIWYKITKNK